MKAVGLLPSSPSGSPYTPTNPAPPSAIHISSIPTPPSPPPPGHLIILMKASTVIRDSLTWPELYASPKPAHLGNDFAGIVAETSPDEKEFRPGDEVYGMARAERGGTWAQYALVASEEAERKPKGLGWEEAAALPLSALTADQALFVHAGLEVGARAGKRVLVTGAGGGVGMFVVAFAAAAGHDVVGACGDEGRDGEFVRGMGAAVVVEYGDLKMQGEFDVVVDTVGGEVLRGCWEVVKGDGALVSVDTASWKFVEEHGRDGLSSGKEGVRALFFIVEPSRQSMERISRAVETKGVKGLVAKTFPFEQAREAYEVAASGGYGRGKVVLTM